MHSLIIQIGQINIPGSEPQCNFNSRGTKEGTLVNLFCSVSYNGNWAPVMQWSQVDLENFIFQATPVNVDAIDPLGNELTSNLSFKVNSSTRSHRYSCKTYFKNSSSTQASRTASNTPEYESLWMSPDAKMFCKYTYLQLQKSILGITFCSNKNAILNTDIAM